MTGALDPEEADVADGLASAALAGDRLALSRLLTALENHDPSGEAALRSLHAHAGRAHVVGITGPPGAGKSTLVSRLVDAARAAGRTVAVLAVDPSSPITGGALLGDRVRMQAHALDDGVFIRSMASRGHPGGLAPTTAAAATVLAACGFTLILLETVGTGQGEVEVARAADTTVVVEAPGMGDEVQAIKAGLLEVADIVVVNKGDRPGALRAAAQLRAMLGSGRTSTRRQGPGGAPRLPPDVLVTTATSGVGVIELLGAIDLRRPHGDAMGRQRLDGASTQVWAIVGQRVRTRLEGGALGESTRSTLAEVAEHRLDPYAAADRLLGRIGVEAGPLDSAATGPADAAADGLEGRAGAAG